jgi:hypothetical protein
MTRNGDFPVLSQRELNRASLSRQLLLRRSDLPVEAAVSHLIALQAQAHKPPYIGLWCRLRNVSAMECDLLLTGKALVRSPLMRGTLHVSTADDALRLSPLFEQILDRTLRSSFGRQLKGLNIAAVALAAREALEQGPLTYAELGQHLVHIWPDRSASALAQVARCKLRVVQAPPLLWNSSERPKVMTQCGWLNREAETTAQLDDIVRRYLAAYGPASIQDMQKWFGLAGFTAVVEGMTDQLCRFHSVGGEVLYDLPNCPRPNVDTIAPVRLLPGFDGAVLGYRDPSRFVDSQHVPKLSSRNGLFHPVFLVDGRIAGLWKMGNSGEARLSLTLHPFGAISDCDRAALVEEAEDLARFTGHDTVDVSIQTI